MALDFRKFTEGLRILPKASLTTVDIEKGDLQVADDADGKLYYNNGSSTSPIVTEDHTATLINKTIDGDDNTIQDLGLASLKTVLLDANKTIRRNASGDVISGNDLPNSSQIVTLDSTDTLTNKTLTSPILNTPSTDTILGIAGGGLTIQSAPNQTLSILSAGTGNVSIQSAGTAVSIEQVSFNGNVVTGGGSSALTLQSGLNQNLSVQAQGTGIADIASKFSLSSILNNQSGSDQTISTTTKPYIKLTNSSLASIGGITASSNDGQFVILTNSTSNPVVILNESAGATASDRIVTGTGGNTTISADGSALLIYNTTSSRWQIVSVVQASSIPAPSITTITTSTALTGSNDYVLVNGTGVTVTLPNPNTLTPGKTFAIKKIFNDVIAVTINTASGTIDGGASKTIATRYQALTITTDGTNYFII